MQLSLIRKSLNSVVFRARFGEKMSRVWFQTVYRRLNLVNTSSEKGRHTVRDRRKADETWPVDAATNRI